MILDALLTLSDHQALEGSGVSKVIDLKQPRDLGAGEPLQLLIQVQPSEAIDVETLTTLQVQIEAADDERFEQNKTILSESPAWTLGQWCGALRTLPWPKGQARRFVRLHYLIDGELESEVMVSAYLIKDSPDAPFVYPSTRRMV